MVFSPTEHLSESPIIQNGKPKEKGNIFRENRLVLPFLFICLNFGLSLVSFLTVSIVTVAELSHIHAVFFDEERGSEAERVEATVKNNVGNLFV